MSSDKGFNTIHSATLAVTDQNFEQLPGGHKAGCLSRAEWQT